MKGKRLLQRVICLAVLGLFVTAGFAHAATPKTVPEIITAYFKSNNLPGLVVSIKKKAGNTVYVRGHASIEVNDPMMPHNIFRIGSVSKLYTTLGIMRLKEKGLLTVDDKLSLYLPDFPYADQITVKNMLQHTSGLPNFAGIDAFASNQAKDWTSDELVAMLADSITSKGALDFSPGTSAAYSNSNFVILGVIIEKVSNQTFKEFVAESVVTPLKMEDTGVGSDTEIIPFRAAGYTVDSGKTTNAQFVSVVAPFATGDFLSRPTEMVKFRKAFTPGALLTQATINEMTAQAVLKDGTPFVQSDGKKDFSFGYCWELVKPTGKTEWIYTKGGSISGFLAYFLYFKTADISIAISTNARGNFDLLDLGLEIGSALKAIK